MFPGAGIPMIVLVPSFFGNGLFTDMTLDVSGTAAKGQDSRKEEPKDDHAGQNQHPSSNGKLQILPRVTVSFDICKVRR